MPTFEYQVRTQTGDPKSGTIDSSSQDAALDALQRQNFFVISLREARGKSLFSFQFRGRVSQKDVVVFSRQLSTLFEASIPIVEALKTLQGETPKAKLKGAIAEILDDVTGGLALSQALAKHSHIFSPFYINLVRSGEESGKLREVFSYLADYLERAHYLATKARNSMIYPAFVLTAFFGVIIVMLVVVIPRLVSIFEETGQTLPFYTQAIIALSNILRKWGFLVIIVLVGGIIFLWRWSMTPPGRFFFHRMQLRIPILGGIYQKIYMARFTDNLQTLIVSGIPILRSLAISADVVGNVIYQRVIEEAIESLRGGSTISSALERSPYVPILVTQMIKIGETSGRLDFILGNIAKYYRREVDSVLENLVALIEPALIIFLGAGVGVLLASVMVPLYNLVGSF